MLLRLRRAVCVPSPIVIELYWILFSTKGSTGFVIWRRDTLGVKVNTFEPLACLMLNKSTIPPFEPNVRVDVVREDTPKLGGTEPPPLGVVPLIDDTTRLSTFTLTVERVDTPVISLLFRLIDDRNVIGEKPAIVETWRVENLPKSPKTLPAVSDDVVKALLFKMYSVWSAGE